MTHKHEWDLDSWDVHTGCTGCRETLTIEEVNRRLNATEELSAEDVDLILFVMVENSIAFNASPERQRIAKALQAYAEKMDRSVAAK